MSNVVNKSNTFSSYLGQEFQTMLMWQILVDNDFGNEIIKNLQVDYFDDPILKRLTIICNEYFKLHSKVPNFQNNTLESAITKFQNPNNFIEVEQLKAMIEKIKLWNSRVVNNQIAYSGDVIQAEAINFIKQQEIRKLGEYILDNVKNGCLDIQEQIEQHLVKISVIGDNENWGTSISDNIQDALTGESRETIPTGILVLDSVTGGGLGKGEIGLILSPSGVGKTTTLSKIANSAYQNGKKVLQIIFEDTENQVKRKHFTLLSGIRLSQLDNNIDKVNAMVSTKISGIENRGGKLIIKRFSQDNTTIAKIRNWITQHQKISGYKFDLVVLDYLDCVESNIKNDRNESELAIIKSFLALSADFNIPCWSALQANRSGFNVANIEADNIGGNIKRYQKAHLFISIAKDKDSRDSNLVNVKVLKARFAKDGQVFNDSILDNDSLNIVLNDSDYQGRYTKLANEVNKTCQAETMLLQSLDNIAS